MLESVAKETSISFGTQLGILNDLIFSNTLIKKGVTYIHNKFSC